MSEFVARVVVERVDRVEIPSTRPRVVPAKIERRKFEIASFAITAPGLNELRDRVQNMMVAAFPIEQDSSTWRKVVQGEPVVNDQDFLDDEDEEDEEEGE